MFWEFFIPLKFRKGTKCKKKNNKSKKLFSKKNWPIHRFKNISIDVLIQNGSKCHSEFVSSNWKGKKWEDVCTFSVVPLQLVHLYKYSIPYNCRQCTMISSRKKVHIVCFPSYFLCVLAHCELLAGLVNIIIVVNVMNKEHPVVSYFQE